MYSTTILKKFRQKLSTELENIKRIPEIEKKNQKIYSKIFIYRNVHAVSKILKWPLKFPPSSTYTL